MISLGLNRGPDKIEKVEDLNPHCHICGRFPEPKFKLCLDCADAIDRAWKSLAAIPEDERAEVYKRLIGG